MLQSHSQIAGLPEPNLLPPLQHLGYWGGFQTGTAYDPVNQAQGLKEFTDKLGGEPVYIEACRNYAMTYYSKALSVKKNALYFLDKTPANVLSWALITKMFPKARYIVLTRHPYAIIHSYAKSFFTGNFAKMANEDTRIPEHIQSVCNFLSLAEVEKYTVSYETLVENPEKEIRDLMKFLTLGYEPAVIQYGTVSHPIGTMGDPLTAAKEKKPEPRYAYQWASAFKDDPSLISLSQTLLSSLSDKDYEIYGYPKETLLEPLKKETGFAKVARRDAGRLYHFQRKIFFRLRDSAREGWFRKALEKIRYYCDILLR